MPRALISVRERMDLGAAHQHPQAREPVRHHRGEHGELDERHEGERQPQVRLPAPEVARRADDAPQLDQTQHAHKLERLRAGAVRAGARGGQAGRRVHLVGQRARPAAPIPAHRLVDQGGQDVDGDSRDQVDQQPGRRVVPKDPAIIVHNGTVDVVAHEALDDDVRDEDAVHAPVDP